MQREAPEALAGSVGQGAPRCLLVAVMAAGSSSAAPGLQWMAPPSHRRSDRSRRTRAAEASSPDAAAESARTAKLRGSRRGSGRRPPGQSTAAAASAVFGRASPPGVPSGPTCSICAAKRAMCQLVLANLIHLLRRRSCSATRICGQHDPAATLFKKHLVSVGRCCTRPSGGLCGESN